jgi:hypothetical protein
MQQQLERQLVRRPMRAPAAVRLSGAALRERRRSANSEHLGSGRALLCECARTACRARVPFSAERHRGRGTDARFLVTPSHIGVDTVVAAADLFFVVEPEPRPAP